MHFIFFLTDSQTVWRPKEKNSCQCIWKKHLWLCPECNAEQGKSWTRFSRSGGRQSPGWWCYFIRYPLLVTFQAVLVLLSQYRPYSDCKRSAPQNSEDELHDHKPSIYVTCLHILQVSSQDVKVMQNNNNPVKIVFFSFWFIFQNKIMKLFLIELFRLKRLLLCFYFDKRCISS